jgi:hypothetical protein
MEGQPFSMNTINVTNIKKFSFNGQLAAIIKGYGTPVTATLFQTLSGRQIKLISILSSLPYEFLNRKPDF